MSIVGACQSPAFFAPWFKNTTSWAPWFAFLRALFGLAMSKADIAEFQRCTGRVNPNIGGYNEAWLVVGRRGGKSLILALIAVYLACFRSWVQYLTPGERGVIVVIAADRRQAGIIFRYIKAFLKPEALASLVQSETREALYLKNNLSIEVQTASFRTVRGHTVVAALCDEIAFWRTDETSKNPDTEILSALRPAMATIPNAMLLAASSPYARRGTLWEARKRYYAVEGANVLVYQSPTLGMHDSGQLRRVVAEAYERDPASAAAEYGAEFRSDIEGFINPEVVDALVVPGRHELPPISGVHYVAFCDPAGGSGQDSFTLCVGHKDNDGLVIIDALRERKPPFSPEATVLEFADLLKSYGLLRLAGDRYAGSWPAEQFAKHGITFGPAEKPKSDLYRDALPLLNSSKVELLDHPRLISQLTGLERRTARGGKDSIDHAPGAHDDLANVVAGVVVALAGKTGAEIWARLGEADGDALLGRHMPYSASMFAQQRRGYR
jgi:hypothetical protein